HGQRQRQLLRRCEPHLPHHRNRPLRRRDAGHDNRRPLRRLQQLSHRNREQRRSRAHRFALGGVLGLRMGQPRRRPRRAAKGQPYAVPQITQDFLGGAFHASTSLFMEFAGAELRHSGPGVRGPSGQRGQNHVHLRGPRGLAHRGNGERVADERQGRSPGAHRPSGENLHWHRRPGQPHAGEVPRVAQVPDGRAGGATFGPQVSHRRGLRRRNSARHDDHPRQVPAGDVPLPSGAQRECLRRARRCPREHERLRHRDAHLPGHHREAAGGHQRHLPPGGGLSPNRVHPKRGWAARRRGLRAGLLAGALALLLCPPSAEAYPWMIRHDYTGCAVCHVDPSGAGLLTDYGRAQNVLLMQMNYGSPIKGDEAPSYANFMFGAFPMPDWLLAQITFRGAEFWVTETTASTPTTAAITESDRRFLMMLLDARAELKFGIFRAAGSIGWGTTPFTLPAVVITNTAGTEQLLARDYWIGLQLDDSLLIRLGRLNLPFGLRNVEHTAWVRNNTGTDINYSQQTGFSVAFDN